MPIEICIYSIPIWLISILLSLISPSPKNCKSTYSCISLFIKLVSFFLLSFKLCLLILKILNFFFVTIWCIFVWYASQKCFLSFLKVRILCTQTQWTNIHFLNALWAPLSSSSPCICYFLRSYWKRPHMKINHLISF